MNDENCYQKIKDLLDEHCIAYQSRQHKPTRTSKESAKARGEGMKIGGKAILLKIDDGFKLFVLSASEKIDSSKIKKYFHARRIRFATAEELFGVTGLVPGSVPPFGLPILHVALYVDLSITKNERIAFNAGSLTDSIIMRVNDYLQIASPEVFHFSG
jgi:prolyl-tRNA editing enzyme YbaK/EbsC (Cys-tRNA(Pro) deacylase)